MIVVSSNVKGVVGKTTLCEYTREEALEIARQYNLESEVKLAMSKGYTPDEALMDWDLYDYTQHWGR